MLRQAVSGGTAPAAAVLQRLTCRDGSRPKVLLAEDSVAARVLMAALLQRMGCDVDAVEDGEDAVSQAMIAPYDIILLDIEMPVLDGVAAARQIRALGGRASATPLMAFSAFLADSAKSGSWRESFDLALPKPAGRSEIHAALASILSPGSPPAARPRPAVSLLRTGRPEAAVLLDVQAIAILRSQMGAEAWRALAAAASQELGSIAAAMAENADTADVAELGRLAHKLKGIALSFSAPRLAGLAGFAEELARLNRLAGLKAATVVIGTCVAETLDALDSAATARRGDVQ